MKYGTCTICGTKVEFDSGKEIEGPNETRREYLLELMEDAKKRGIFGTKLNKIAGNIMHQGCGGNVHNINALKEAYDESMMRKELVDKCYEGSYINQLQ